MPTRALIELLHIAIGIAATALIVVVSAWAYPLARVEMEITGVAAAIVVVLLGIGPLRRAWSVDRRRGASRD